MCNYNILMNLEAKASRGLACPDARAEAGYAMAALLVAMSVMAIILTAAMPTWSQMIRREKEEELIFRGNQYARAINQYQRKFANASPASLDVLIEQRLLRKKFRDPLATDKEGEFQMLYLNQQGPASRGGPAGQTGARGTGSGPQQTGTGSVQGGTQGGTSYSTQPSGGIVGVASKNTGTSIRIYKGKQRYNEWQFIGMEMSQQAGAGSGGAGAGRGRGGREGGREGGRGIGGFGGRGDGRGGFTTPDGGTTFIPRGGGPSRQGR